MLSGSLHLKAQMAFMSFVPFNCSSTAQEAVHYRHTHAKLVLRQVVVSGSPISYRVLNHHHHQHMQSLSSLISSKKSTSVLRVDAYSSSTQDMSPLTKSSPEGASSQIPQLQDVVIVGGGIAGLATALALHRLGVVKPVLLEQSDELRTAGSAIGLFTNAWKALESLGVADGFREKFVRIAGAETLGEDGNKVTGFMFNEGSKVSRDVELRAVERKALLETLQEPLPDGTVFYDSKVVGIKKLDGGRTEVQCKNGQTIQTKVLIGCDGVGSVVGKYMNMGKLRYAGYTATRGLAVYPDGHNLSPIFKQIVGRGGRAAIVPMDANKVYWFVGFNCPDERLSDLELVREEVLNYVKGWPSIVTETINRTPLESFSRRGIADRWMLPVGGPPLYKGGVTLAGDAMHPMTPNLGQGGCCALEDAVMLARRLSKALSARDYAPSNGSANDGSNGSANDGSQEMERVELALKAYTEERWPRMLRLAIQSNFVGAFIHSENELMRWARSTLMPKLLNVDTFMNHTLYDCGKLQ